MHVIPRLRVDPYKKAEVLRHIFREKKQQQQQKKQNKHTHTHTHKKTKKKNKQKKKKQQQKKTTHKHQKQLDFKITTASVSGNKNIIFFSLSTLFHSYYKRTETYQYVIILDHLSCK